MHVSNFEWSINLLLSVSSSYFYHGQHSVGQPHTVSMHTVSTHTDSVHTDWLFCGSTTRVHTLTDLQLKGTGSREYLHRCRCCIIVIVFLSCICKIHSKNQQTEACYTPETTFWFTNYADYSSVFQLSNQCLLNFSEIWTGSVLIFSFGCLVLSNPHKLPWCIIIRVEHQY